MFYLHSQTAFVPMVIGFLVCQTSIGFEVFYQPYMANISAAINLYIAGYAKV